MGPFQRLDATMMQEERDKEKSLRAAQRDEQTAARGAALQAYRTTEDTEALQALSSLRMVIKKQQTAATPSLPAAASIPQWVKAGMEAPGVGVTPPQRGRAGGAHRATSSIGNAALVPGKHHRTPSWVKRRASSLDEGSAAALAGALLAGPKATHQKSSSHDSVLPGKLSGLEKQYSRLSSAAMLADNMAHGGQMQARKLPQIYQYKLSGA